MTRPRFVELFRAARRVGTPLIAIETPDPAATIARLRSEAIAESTPIVVWDVVRGWRPGNEPGRAAIQEALPDADPAQATINPVEALIAAAGLPPKSVLFMLGGNRAVDGSPSNAATVQAAWNLRDQFKANLRTLVLLGPSFSLPPELQNDVLLLDEPLPTDTELAEIVSDVLQAAEKPAERATIERAVDALRGLAAFAAEQAVAMSIEPENGLDVPALWDRKRKMISATPGLAVWTGGERFDDLGGNAQIKRFVRRLLGGRDAPRVVVFIDEIEKMLAGATGAVGDSSGVSQGQLQQLLTFMQDTGASGLIFVGPPGAGKSAVAKAIGAEGGIPTIALDLGGMKASLVGESEQRLRTALKVVQAVGGGRSLFVATCNKIGGLPPELRRRFTLGTWYFDLPDEAERAAIWHIYRQAFGLGDEPGPESDGWTGAEIRTAAMLAYRLSIPLADTAQFIVPVARAASQDIEALRRQADGRWLSASYPGVYRLSPAREPALITERPRRAIAQEV